MTAAIPIAWTVAWVALLLLFEHRDHRLGVWVAKPMASVGFIVLAWHLGRATGYRIWILAALLACAAGDVLLIPRERKAAFLAGVGAFAVGHLCYARAFWEHPVDPLTAGLSAAGLAGAGVVVFRWLRPHLPPEMVAPVVGYIAIIAGMVACAFGAVAAGADVHIALGATLFFVSDLSVARDAFVARAFINRAWGLPMYYAAQLLLACTQA